MAALPAPSGVMRVVGRKPRDREHLLPTEIDKLIEAARKTRHGLRDSTLLRMMFSHGLRLTEATELTWKQLDLDNGVFHVVRKKDSRNGDHKLRGGEIRALRKLSRATRLNGPTDLVFRSERKDHPRLSNRAVQEMVTRIAERAGLGELNIHPHAFRHSTGYYMSERGMNLQVIQTYLGHKEIRHTKRYVEVSTRQFEGMWDD